MPTVLVLGAGTMGAGIAQICAQSGHTVYLRDIRKEFVTRGVNAIGNNLARMVEKGRMPKEEHLAVLGRIAGIVDMAEAAHADIVVEAALENMDVKKSIFRELDEIIQPEAILASNTSSLSVTEFASATKRPEKVIGMHFFNPVPVMALVEVIRGHVTSDATYASTMDFVKKLGKSPITVHEAPGFVVNRILIPTINEGCFILSEGVASAEDIDAAMKLGANQPMGPLALGDLIGLDVCLAIMETLHRETGDPKYRPAPLMRKMVRANMLGRKTGQGFYTY